MNTTDEHVTYCGIEIFKYTLDAFYNGHYREFCNNERGFNQLLKWCPGRWFIVTSNNPFCSWLIHYLYQHGNRISVINPPHHFYSWKLRAGSKHKTNAALLVDFARDWALPAWKPKETHVLYIRQLNERIKSKENAICRQETLQEQPVISRKALPGARNYIQRLKCEKNQLEQAFYSVLNRHYGESYLQLITLPGVSRPSAVSLLAYLEELAEA
jgi:hypothetical protein